MEAPDRIYFDGNDRACKIPIFSSTNIEYIRTDAFIEKACEYFRNKKKCVFACIGEDVYHSLLNEEEIDDFKKYMKGE